MAGNLPYLRSIRPLKALRCFFQTRGSRGHSPGYVSVKNSGWGTRSRSIEFMSLIRRRRESGENSLTRPLRPPPAPVPAATPPDPGMTSGGGHPRVGGPLVGRERAVMRRRQAQRRSHHLTAPSRRRDASRIREICAVSCAPFG